MRLRANFVYEIFLQIILKICNFAIKNSFFWTKWNDIKILSIVHEKKKYIHFFLEKKIHFIPKKKKSEKKILILKKR